MSNALHDYAKLFEKYAANNGGTGAILAGEDCLALANEMRMDADDLERENAKLRELVRDYHTFISLVELAQPIGHIVAAHGHPTLSIAALDERYRELGVEVDE